MSTHDRSGELRDRLAKLMGEEARIGMETASNYDQVQEELAAEQQHVEELREKLRSGEDSPQLSEEYIEACNRVGGLQELLGTLSDDKEEGRRYRGPASG